MEPVSIRMLLDAGVHFGHRTRYWSPSMKPYIYGQRENTHIIDLGISLPLFEEAMNYVGKLAADKKTILFVGTKRRARKVVAQYAEECGMPYINHRWLGGLLTNFRTIRKSVDHLLSLEKTMETGDFAGLKKREIQGLRREQEKLERSVGGVKTMKRLPDALFVIDVGHEKIAVREAHKMGIPVIGIVDTNNEPYGIDYIIPGNDDSISAITLYAQSVASAVQDARVSSNQIDEDDFVEVTEDGEEVRAH